MDFRYLSLCALYEIAQDARRGPVKGSLALRIVLALAHDHADDRGPFDDFWRECRETHWQEINKSTGDFHRGLATDKAWRAIACAMGHTVTDELIGQIRDTCDPKRRRHRQ